MTDLRPLADADVDGLEALPMAAFDDLARRQGRRPEPWDDERGRWWRRRMRHLLATDPALQWVALDGGDIVGISSASMREGLWGLSLLVVRPGLQSAGLGRRLIDAALAGATGPGVICASDDGRALRRYAVAGFAIHPALTGTGHADLSAYIPDPHVRDGVDPAFADAVDRISRGHGHGPDHGFLQTGDGFGLAYEDGARRAYAYGAAQGWIGLVVGTEPAAAAAVLRAALARTVELGVPATVGHVTGGQPWATEVLVGMRLSLALDGAVCWRGMAEPTAYIPHGAFL